MTKTVVDQFSSHLTTLKSTLGLEQMTAREKTILIAGGAFVAAVLIFQLAISPYLDSRTRLINSIERKKKELTEVIQLKQEYADLQIEAGGIKENLAKRPAGFTLFAFLDKQAEKADVKTQIKYMKPSVLAGVGDSLDESVVEVKMEGVTLASLVNFLRLTESDEDLVTVRRLSIQKSGREEGLLDVILQVVTFVEAG